MKTKEDFDITKIYNIQQKHIDIDFVISDLKDNGFSFQHLCNIQHNQLDQSKRYSFINYNEISSEKYYYQNGEGIKFVISEVGFIEDHPEYFL